jgi:hypothetical protein
MLAALLLAAASNLQATPAPPPPVTAIGCIAQSPDNATAPPTGHEQAAAKGLMLARATVRSDARGGAGRSAVPGSLPSGSGSGTTDGNRISSTAPRVEQAFWLVGAKAPELLRFVGRRAEITGTIDEKLGANPGGQSVTDAGGAAARRAATAPADPPVTAHPSAPARAISVTTFRVLEETCRNE